MSKMNDAPSETKRPDVCGGEGVSRRQKKEVFIA